MGWTTTTASTVTWGGGTTATKTYTAPAPATVVWHLPRPLGDSPAPALDFEYQFRDTGFMLFSEDRPFLFLSSVSEGNP